MSISGLHRTLVCLLLAGPCVLALPANGVLAQDAQGWAVVGPELVRQVDSLTAPAILARSVDLVVDAESFARAGSAVGWGATPTDAWEGTLGMPVRLEAPPRVPRGPCQQRISCPFEGEPRIYRLMQITDTLPPPLSDELPPLPPGHLLATLRLEFNLGVPGERSWRSGHYEYAFILDAEAQGGVRIVSMVGLVKIATGGGP